MLLDLILILVINILWQIGGQGWKPARRFILPFIALLTKVLENHKDRCKKKKYAPITLILLLPALLMGYGENSKIRKFCGGSDKLTRLLYASILSIPFLIGNIILGTVWKYPICLGILIGAFQVRAGTLFKIKGKDILIEDIFRATATGISITLTF